MTIKIVPKHPEECPDHEYRCIVRPNDPHTVEIASEDGAFCPCCGSLQQLSQLRLNSLNQCRKCSFWFNFARMVTFTYITCGTISPAKEQDK